MAMIAALALVCQAQSGSIVADEVIDALLTAPLRETDQNRRIANRLLETGEDEHAFRLLSGEDDSDKSQLFLAFKANHDAQRMLNSVTYGHRLGDPTVIAALASGDRSDLMRAIRRIRVASLTGEKLGFEQSDTRPKLVEFCSLLFQFGYNDHAAYIASHELTREEFLSNVGSLYRLYSTHPLVYFQYGADSFKTWELVKYAHLTRQVLAIDLATKAVLERDLVAEPDSSRYPTCVEMIEVLLRAGRIDDAKAVAKRYWPDVVDYYCGAIDPLLMAISPIVVAHLPEVVRAAAERNETDAAQFAIQPDDRDRALWCLAQASQCYRKLDDRVALERALSQAESLIEKHPDLKRSTAFHFVEAEQGPVQALRAQLADDAVTANIASKAIDALIAGGELEVATDLARESLSCLLTYRYHVYDTRFARSLRRLGMMDELSAYLRRAAELVENDSAAPELYLELLAIGDEAEVARLFLRESLPAQKFQRIAAKWDEGRQGPLTRLSDVNSTDLLQVALEDPSNASNPAVFSVLLATVQGVTPMRDQVLEAIRRELERNLGSRFSYVARGLLDGCIPSPRTTVLSLENQRAVAQLVRSFQ